MDLSFFVKNTKLLKESNAHACEPNMNPMTIRSYTQQLKW